MNYSTMVRKLAKPGEVIVEEITPVDAHMIHMAIGISSEAGELLDAIKKAVIYRKKVDVDNVIEELGDLEFYMEGLRQSFSITREQVIDCNIKKLSKRYHSMSYSDDQAQQRADKE